MDIVSLLARDPVIGRIAERALRARRVTVRGLVGSSGSFTAAALSLHTGRPVMLVLAHSDEADEAFDELCSAGVVAARMPALETLPGESAVSLDALAERVNAVRTMQEWSTNPNGKGSRVFVTTIAALMQGVPRPEATDRVLRTVRVGESVKGGPAGLVRWLDGAGFTRVESIEEPGQFAVRGGILDVFPPGDPTASTPEGDESLGGVPVRLDFLGDEVEKITEIDLQTMAPDRSVRSVQIVCAAPESVQSESATVGPATLVPPTSIVALTELLELTEQGRGYFERLINSAGISGPPAVFKALQERAAATVELTALGQYASGDDHLVGLPVYPVPPLDHDVSVAVGELGKLATGESELHGGPLRCTVFCQNDGELQRFSELLAEHAPSAEGKVKGVVRYLHAGFGWGEGEQAALVLPYSELLHRFTVRRRGRARLRAGRAMDAFLELEVGDYVVHQDYGIARFTGLVMMKPREAQRGVDDRLRAATGKGMLPAKDDEPLQEYLSLEFDGSAKLHVPATKVDLVQKYIGGGGGSDKPGAGGRTKKRAGPPLSKLGGDRWKHQKERVAESVRDMAAELLRVRAVRESLPGHAFPADTVWQRSFEEEFPYQETEDQLASLQEIKRDMTRARPMDRLLCGDVGFGKTELAVRAAFKAAEAGKQVAVLVPTTVLAEQHERTFAGRFADYPFKVASVSRFKSDQEVRETLAGLAAGHIDVIVGTHRLLSKDVGFKDLGLVIVDEEQRFGVEHKERLLGLRMSADVLTLSATPIPRTLHMGMMGLRDISSLATAPLDRRAVVTEVIPYNTQRLKQVIDRELARDGQVYYVHNRVHDIHSVADDVQKMAPSARVVVGHGQMSPGELEDVMHAFTSRRADILVSTTIIESGIDIPTANTIIIEDADRFGLADLHQLRGRVGRSKHRGYCYLLLPDNRPLKEKAKQRLKALEQFSMLGAGFKIAMRDLEIRGAGNILGPEQSGHIAVVGYDMYCQLLERAVKALKNETVTVPSECALELGVHGAIPKPYIPSDTRRLEAYRRIALAGSQAELDKVRGDLSSAYGPMPEPAERLLRLAALRIGARVAGVRLIYVRSPDVIFRTGEPLAVVEALRGAPGKVTALPATGPGQLPEVYFRPDNPATLEGPSLLNVLCRRFAPEVAATPASATQAPGSRSAPAAPASPGVRKPTLKPPPLSKELKAMKLHLRRKGSPPPKSP